MSESTESAKPEPKFAVGDQVFGPRRDRLMVVTRVEWTSDRYFCGLSDIVPGVPTYGWWTEGELQLHYRPAAEPDPRDAEIKQLCAEIERLRAEIARLTIDRDAMTTRKTEPAPPGWTILPVKVATDGTTLVMIGTPPDEGEPFWELHNCDEMGCGLEHVLVRLPSYECLSHLIPTPGPILPVQLSMRERMLLRREAREKEARDAE